MHKTPIDHNQFTMEGLAEQIAHACKMEARGQLDRITYRMLVGNFARAILNKIGE